jgi:hypothetical protein
MEKETEDRLAPPTLEPDERLRHALMFLDEARRTVVRVLNELARAEHERLEDRKA